MSWQVPNINGQLSSELVNSGWTIYKSTQSGQGNTQAVTGGQPRLFPTSFATLAFCDSSTPAITPVTPEGMVSTRAQMGENGKMTV